MKQELNERLRELALDVSRANGVVRVLMFSGRPFAQPEAEYHDAVRAFDKALAESSYDENVRLRGALKEILKWCEGDLHSCTGEDQSHLAHRVEFVRQAINEPK